MSNELGIAITLITLGSCFASYKLGQLNILARYEKYERRRKEREARWAEFEEDEE